MGSRLTMHRIRNFFFLFVVTPRYLNIKVLLRFRTRQALVCSDLPWLRARVDGLARLS